MPEVCGFRIIPRCGANDLSNHPVFAHRVGSAGPVLAIITIYLGLADRRAAHRRLARWTFPIWLYVSITGVLVYLMLYQLYPPRDREVKMFDRRDGQVPIWLSSTWRSVGVFGPASRGSTLLSCEEANS